ncbi:MAG: preprotein translocase subunit SecE [Candidatus Nanopelagicales bacterium]|nr:preprotein translocase subunit SecE [Candidatus Nanopelagicales bacterium]MDZ4248697.1 preprotein translocase subunit SecE [Candidatus Nanopelagicales bacterium]MDZ7577045.1 preprotein translocase subunit SecE [Candidatus Nanopelagicales bacterium]
MSEAETAKTDKKLGLIARLSLFVREIMAELRKVIWPTRKELITYTGVVIVFVLAMAGIVALLDFVFGKGVLFTFGGGGE